MRYYISDCHFFDETMIRNFDCRPFATVEEMNRVMIERWNERVKKRDEVVILGDFSFGTAAQTNELLEQLNGNLFLILGNHDWVIRDKKLMQDRFVWIHHYQEMKDNGRRVVLSHYPVLCYNGQYAASKKGDFTTYMLYGHVHASKDQQIVDQCQELVRAQEITRRDGTTFTAPSQMLNCFCMYSDYRPFTLDEWIAFHSRRKEIQQEK